MATLPEIRYAIIDRLRGGITSDDELLSNREIDFLIHTKRGRLIKEYLQKNNDELHPEFLQTIKCLAVELVDKSECCEIATDCLILRTTQEIPVVYNNMFTYIGPVDDSMNFQLVSFNRSRWDRFSRFTAHIPKAYYLNNKVSITVTKTIEVIKIIGVFEDPTKLADLNVCEGTCFDINTSTYPIPSFMTDLLIQLVLQDLRVLNTLDNDTTNNTASEPKA